jgi:hypothetical protein
MGHRVTSPVPRGKGTPEMASSTELLPELWSPALGSAIGGGRADHITPGHQGEPPIEWGWAAILSSRRCAAPTSAAQLSTVTRRIAQFLCAAPGHSGMPPPLTPPLHINVTAEWPLSAIDAPSTYTAPDHSGVPRADSPMTAIWGSGRSCCTPSARSASIRSSHGRT